MEKTVLGIDVGGTTTKIVGFRKNGTELHLISPQLVRAADPVTSIYGALGKFTAENQLELSGIHRVMMTGTGAAVVKDRIYDLKITPVSEFSSIGRGGLYLAGIDEAIVISMGTGTALVHAKKNRDTVNTEYLGGTGVGGGTLVGLSRKLLGVDHIEELEKLYAEGNLENVDLRIRDISKNRNYGGMNEDLTAANFGKVSDLAKKADLALGIANMVTETIAMIAVFAARNFGIKDVVLVGNMTAIRAIREIFFKLSDSLGVNFLIPEDAQFGTVIGAALSEE